MFKSPGRTLIIVFAVFVALFAGLFLSGMIIRDFQHYLKNEHMDLVLLVRAEIAALVWSFCIAGLALGLGFLLSRRSTLPNSKPIQETALDGKTGVQEGMPVQEKGTAPDLPKHAEEVPAQGASQRIIAPVIKAASVNNVALVVEAMPEDIPDDPADLDDEDMQPLASDADRITKVVKGLDELAKAQALGRALQKQPLELAQFLNSIIEKARETTPNKDVRFFLECTNDFSLNADHACLMGIMTNLLDNAAKAVKKGGTVTVSAVADSDCVVIAVKDTGTGIRRKNIPHLFERFYRGAGGGIGLGLTIVKELVDACGGTIEVQSTRGKGSIFTVRIPLSRPVQDRTEFKSLTAMN